MFTGFYSRTDFYCFLDQDMSFKFNMDKGLSNESNSVEWDKTANKPNKYDPEVNFLIFFIQFILQLTNRVHIKCNKVVLPVPIAQTLDKY